MKPRRGLLMLVLWLSLPAPAFAHHAMGGETPSSFLQGFLSGLAHPIIGLDHLLFLLTAGVLAFSLKSPLRHLAPALFVASACGGTALHLARFGLSGVEVLIATTLTVAGASVVWRQRVGAVALGAFFGLAGVFHGYAYAESIVGAQSGPPTAYLVGLAVVQMTIMSGVAHGLGTLSVLGRQSDAARAAGFAGRAALAAGVVLLAVSFA